jgi:hypothetical protein
VNTELKIYFFLHSFLHYLGCNVSWAKGEFEYEFEFEKLNEKMICYENFYIAHGAKGYTSNCIKTIPADRGLPSWRRANTPL